MNDGQRVIATKMIETRLHLYDTFFDSRWAQDLSTRMPAQLSEAFDHLSLAWKEAANTHRLPWLMVQQMKGFADGLTRNHKPYLARFVEGVKQMILNGLSGALKRSERKTVEGYIKTMDQKLRLAEQQQSVVAFPIDNYWNWIIGVPDFQLSIAGSQGQALCAVIFAYEWFLVSVFRALGGGERLRPNDARFWAQFASMIGGDPEGTYWDDSAVKIARLTRNSIAHLGGKAKPELLAEKHGLYVSPEGIISVQPLNNRELFRVLKDKVTRLVAEATPKFVIAA